MIYMALLPQILNMSESKNKNKLSWWSERELNPRPLPRQGSALPLSYRPILLFKKLLYLFYDKVIIMPDEKIRPRRSLIIHIFLKMLSAVFLLLGVAGLFLPIIPGIPLFVIGLILLGEESRLGQRIISVLPEKIRESIKKRQLKH